MTSIFKKASSPLNVQLLWTNIMMEISNNTNILNKWKRLKKKTKNPTAPIQKT
jgi:hypothetical protein